MPMAVLTLHLKMVGSEPTQYFESLKGTGNYNNVISQTRTRTASVDGTFTTQLAKRVGVLFEQSLTFGPVKAEGLITNEDPVRHIADTELLCYVCADERNSVLRRFDQARFERVRAKNPKGAGVTANMILNKVFEGILSEIWLNRLNNDITAAAFGVYHEWMHNKTNWNGNEDPDWVHRVPNGGLSAENDDGLLGLTPGSAGAMAKRLWFRNQQFVRGL
jgi:hypothetical protein